jgi:hypothetical protein
VALARLALFKIPTVIPAAETLKDAMLQIIKATHLDRASTMPEEERMLWSGLLLQSKSGSFLVAPLLAIFFRRIPTRVDGELQLPTSKEDATLTLILPIIRSLST